MNRKYSSNPSTLDGDIRNTKLAWKENQDNYQYSTHLENIYWLEDFEFLAMRKVVESRVKVNVFPE